MKQAIRYACAVALLWLAGACHGRQAPTREWTPADHGQPPMPDSDRVPSAQAESTEESSARAARALWNATCAGCHGRDARGHGEAKPPGAQLPDLTASTWQSSRSDEQIAQIIHDGRGMMPGFGKQLNDQGIEVLVHHVRGFAAPVALDGAAQGPPTQ